MCGFAGVVRWDGRPDANVVRRMTDILVHRGPDDSGVFVDGAVGFGFRRLAILDLSPAGHQPMTTPDGRFTIVFNGEIYNYVELRKELMTRGHSFRSTGDSEVLLRAWAEWGAECLPRLNGMWAFLVWDAQEATLFGSRDRFGIKPLYRYLGPGFALFASEIKALRASGLCPSTPNWTTVASFLLDGRLDETSATFYTGVEQVGAGSAFALRRNGSYREWRFWSLDSIAREPVPPRPAEAFAELFEDAVRVHMRSDVPVGVNLSGGLDSTSIICAAARVREASKASEPLLAFSYNDPEFDEWRYLKDTVELTNAKLMPLLTNPQRLWDDLARVLWFQDEPVHSMTALVGYQLMALAAEHRVKVILNGQGADETIGGYSSYFRDYWFTLARRDGLRRTWGEIGAFTEVHGGRQGAVAIRVLRHVGQTRVAKLPGYGALRRLRSRRRHLANEWFTRELADVAVEAAPEAWELDDVLVSSVVQRPMPLYLRVEDRNSMAHSIECRLPFLDFRLVSLIFGLPKEWKLRGPWNKYVLREAMRGKIPESVRVRPDKMGFPTPGPKWMAGSLYDPLLDVLNSRQARERGIYNIDAILRDLRRHREGGQDVSPGLFSVAELELWFSIGQSASPYAPRG